MLALAQLRTGRFERAIASAREAVEGGDRATINDLIMAIAHARLADQPAADQEFERAEETWPDELRDEGTYVASADNGILWFDTAAKLVSLLQEARYLIGAPAVK